MGITGGFSIRHTHWLNSILDRTMNLKMYSKAFIALKSWSVIPHFSALSTYVFKTLVSFLFKYKNTYKLQVCSQRRITILKGLKNNYVPK